jgi:5-methylcytosine-specific restriction endonuclease McrA
MEPAFDCIDCGVTVFRKEGGGRPPKAPHCRKCYDKARKQADRDAKPRVCRACGVVHKRTDRQFCSDECAAVKMESNVSAWRAAKAAAKAVPRQCAWCSSEFVAKSEKSPKIYCCDECKTRAGWEKRTIIRRLRGGDHVAPKPVGLSILRRDGWRCVVCSIETPESLRGTYMPNAPEVDHIFPVSRGGTHEPDNLQCLCRSCNSKKSDKTMAEWLAQTANDNQPMKVAA